MAALFKWFSNSPVAPERVPSDAVIPLYRHDDTFTNRNLSFEYTMRFEEVLDADKLADALWKLFEKPGWRKLGGRLRLNDRGKLECHVPAEFTKERPPINFTQVKHDMPLSHHPLGGKVVRTDGTLRVFDTKEPWRSDLENNHSANLLADWIYTDRAQLGLHVVTFTDATFVTLNWLHTFIDAMGRRTLLDAWTAMLEGRESDVPEFLYYDEDPFEQIGAPQGKKSDQTEKEEFVLKDKLIKGFGMLTFVFNFIWEAIFYPQETGRFICVPATYMEKLRREAMEDLASAPPGLLTLNNSDSSNSKPFLSEGDIICAWTVRLIARFTPTINTSAASKKILVMNVFGLRDLLSKPTDSYPTIIPKGKAYIGNCVAAIFSHFTVKDLISMPLGHAAARIRKDLTIQGTRSQVEALQRLGREHSQPLFGNGSMALSAFSNWTKARLFETDFSAAIVKEALGRPEIGVVDKMRGKPVYIQPFPTTGKGLILRGSANCIGKDHEGNLWVGILLRNQFVPLLEREIERIR